MLTIEREDGVMFLDASGHISAADIEAFEPVFEQFAHMQGKVPMVIDATELEGYEPAALWHDMKFDTTHRDQIGPAAIISDGGWKAWATGCTRWRTGALPARWSSTRTWASRCRSRR